VLVDAYPMLPGEDRGVEATERTEETDADEVGEAENAVLRRRSPEVRRDGGENGWKRDGDLILTDLCCIEPGCEDMYTRVCVGKETLKVIFIGY
jgi:hypothetical protein